MTQVAQPETQPATPSQLRAMTGREWLMLVVLAILWGGSFLFNAIALRDLPVLTTVFMRVFLAALVLMMVLRLSGEHLPRRAEVWRALFVLGFLNNAVPFSLIVWGQQYVAAGVASILNATTPLFTVIFAHVLTRDERLDGGRILGVLLGFLGVVVMIGHSAGEGGAGLGSGFGAQFLFLGAAASYGLAGIYGRRFKPMGVSPMVTATGQLIASSVLLMPLALIMDRPWHLPMPGPSALAALLALAVLSTAFAYVLYFRILAAAGATSIALVTFLIPVCAIFLGILVLGEHLEPRQLAGMALIGAGLAAIDGRPWRKIRGWFAGRGGAVS